MKSPDFLLEGSELFGCTPILLQQYSSNANIPLLLLEAIKPHFYNNMKRFLSADYVFPISQAPLEKGIVVIEGQSIVDVVTTAAFASAGGDLNAVEMHNGFITPGFVNVHCHLELSALKGLIPEHTGLPGFIKAVIEQRKSLNRELIQQAIEEAETEMIRQGIVAVGDISNDGTTFSQKSKGAIRYHTFFEVFDLNPKRAQEVMDQALALQHQLAVMNAGSSSIVPHAPYTVTQELFNLIREQAIVSNSILTYHNQESESETELFVSKTGAFADAFTQMGFSLDYIPNKQLNSIRSTLPYFNRTTPTLLVHNTYMSQADIAYAQLQLKNLYFCFCPRANQYIEGRLPNILDFMDAGALCTIGTDSLASNHSLSILEEIKLIALNKKELPLQALLSWATLNGARFLRFEKELGSLEKGKRPGINLIEEVDSAQLKLKQTSRVKRLV